MVLRASEGSGEDMSSASVRLEGVWVSGGSVTYDSTTQSKPRVCSGAFDPSNDHAGVPFDGHEFCENMNKINMAMAALLPALACLPQTLLGINDVLVRMQEQQAGIVRIEAKVDRIGERLDEHIGADPTSETAEATYSASFQSGGPAGLERLIVELPCADLPNDDLQGVSAELGCALQRARYRAEGRDCASPVPLGRGLDAAAG